MSSFVLPGRTRSAMCAVFLFGIAVVPGLQAPASAQEQSVEARKVGVITFDRAYCDVTVDNPHPSTAYIDEISARSNVACYFRSGNGAPFIAEKIRIESKITVIRPQGGISGGTVKTCAGEKVRRYSFSLPCHGRLGEPGQFTGIAKAFVTIDGQTKSGSASNTKWVAGGSPIA